MSCIFHGCSQVQAMRMAVLNLRHTQKATVTLGAHVLLRLRRLHLPVPPSSSVMELY
jgi:hypothetical protein